VTSTQAEIDRSYSVSNDFFKLWLDENMHYTSAAFDEDGWTLEQAQEHKARVLYDFAELDATKTVCDIGSGWGSAIDCFVRFGIREAHGITLSTEQLAYCHERNFPADKVKFWLQDYALFTPPAELKNARGASGKYDGLVSIEMIDHLCSPAQAREGLAVGLYRAYFDRLAQWVEPGAAFGFQAILRNRIPRTRKDLDDLAFTADVIFPGGLNPRIEELVVANRLRQDHRGVARAAPPAREDDPGAVGRPAVRRLRAVPRHLRPRLREPLVGRRPDEAQEDLTSAGTIPNAAIAVDRMPADTTAPTPNTAG